MRTLPPATTDGAEPLTPSKPVGPPRQILREVLLLGSMYVVYSLGRIYAAKHSSSAFDNTHPIDRADQANPANLGGRTPTPDHRRARSPSPILTGHLSLRTVARGNEQAEAPASGVRPAPVV